MFFDPELLKSAHFALSLVLHASILTGLGFVFGLWMDTQLETEPYMQIISTFFFFILGIYQLITRIRRKK